MVRYRVDMPGLARPMKSEVFMTRKWRGMNKAGVRMGGRLASPV